MCENGLRANSAFSSVCALPARLERIFSFVGQPLKQTTNLFPNLQTKRLTTMPKDYSRTRRVGEQIQREMAQLVQQEIKDPRLGLVTISAVKLSKDMSHANIFFTVIDNGEEDKDNQTKEASITETVKILEGASGFLRHELAKRMQLRIVPHIHFKYDDSIAHGNELSALISKAMGMENPENRMSDSDDKDDE